jgi:hypothetical protein
VGACSWAMPAAPLAANGEIWGTSFVAIDVLCQPPFVSDERWASKGWGSSGAGSRCGEVWSPETGSGESLGGGLVEDGACRGRDGDGDVGVAGRDVWRGRMGCGCASIATRHGTRRGRRSGSRGGARDRADGLGRRDSGPRGASGGCCPPAGRTRRVRRLLHARRKPAVFHLPDSWATAAWPASAARASRSG